MLGGALRKVKKGRRSSDHQQEAIEKHGEQLEAYEALCDDLGEAPADVALAWLLHNPVVTAPIIGPRTIEQLDGSLRALEIELDEDTLAKLDEIWPGPGGAAPEAYAW
jgi:aryl-alcohol dehydrogenase-like predicted oxidoreductase